MCIRDRQSPRSAPPRCGGMSRTRHACALPCRTRHSGAWSASASGSHTSGNPFGGLSQTPGPWSLTITLQNHPTNEKGWHSRQARHFVRSSGWATKIGYCSRRSPYRTAEIPLQVSVCLTQSLINEGVSIDCLLYTSDAADEEDSVDLG